MKGFWFWERERKTKQKLQQDFKVNWVSFVVCLFLCIIIGITWHLGDAIILGAFSVIFCQFLIEDKAEYIYEIIRGN